MKFSLQWNIFANSLFFFFFFPEWKTRNIISLKDTQCALESVHFSKQLIVEAQMTPGEFLSKVELFYLDWDF